MQFERKKRCNDCRFSNYCIADGTHIHQCEKCGTTWQHPQPPEDISNIKAHTCPKCGEEEWYKLHISSANKLEKIDYPWTGVWPEEWRLTLEEKQEIEDYGY